MENILQFHTYKYNLFLLIIFLKFKIKFIQTVVFIFYYFESYYCISDQRFVPIQSNQFQTIRKLRIISI